MNKAVIFGANQVGRLIFRYLGGENVYCFADNLKAGGEFCGKSVISFEQLCEIHEEYDICIAVEDSTGLEIEKQLISAGINRFIDLKRLIRNDWIGISNDNCEPDLELSGRISASYKLQLSENVTCGDVHMALLGEDIETLSKKLANPDENDLLYGFDNLTKSSLMGGEDSVRSYLFLCYSCLRRLGEAWNAISFENNEPLLPYVWPEPLSIIDKLNELFACRIDFPNPYRLEMGLPLTREPRREIVSHRAIQALHQAFIMYEKLGRKPGRILEIGAGLGRTAYYMRSLFDFNDYTIIDLPLSLAASAHFLAKTLGNDAISLYGEPEKSGSIRILPPETFLSGALGKFDIILNVDSLTETSYDTMRSYWEKIKECSKSFLSINREVNEHTVHELAFNDNQVNSYSRKPCWLRSGYIEEFMTF